MTTTTTNQVPTIPLEDISYDWCLGKPCGCIIKNDKTVFWRTSAKGKRVNKSFAISKYDNSFEKAELAALEYGKKWSDEHGYTRNQVRRLPDGVYWKDNERNGPVTKDTLEVKIDDTYTMLVDYDDLITVQEYAICKVKGGAKNSQYYSAMSFKGSREDKKQKIIRSVQRFHNFITGFDMVDHKNRNPMDNRRCNLLHTTKKENNNNRSCLCSGMKYAPAGIEKVPGVRFTLDRPGGSWQARIKQDGKEKTVSFSIKTHGEFEACRLAVEARKQFNETFECSNSLTSVASQV